MSRSRNARSSRRSPAPHPTTAPPLSPPVVAPRGDTSLESTFETRAEMGKLQYELLGILDSKASALLTFDALALTVLSIWLGYIPLNYMHASLDVVFILLLLSCVLLLVIIWLRWAKKNENEETLNVTRLRRTRCYRVSWGLSLASIAIIVLVSCIHAFGTFLIATQSCGPTCQSFYSEKVFGNLDYGQ